MKYKKEVFREDPFFAKLTYEFEGFPVELIIDGDAEYSPDFWNVKVFIETETDRGRYFVPVAFRKELFEQSPKHCLEFAASSCIKAFFNATGYEVE